MKAAIFDMDGTLIDSLIFWRYLWKKIGETFQNDPSFLPDEQTDLECRTVTMAAAMGLVHARYGVAKTAEELTKFTTELLGDFYQNVVLPKPGVLEFLQYLQSKGVKLAVATASNTELVQLAMDRCGISAYIHEIYSCATVGKGKEHPDVFLMAMEHLGAKPEETWMFEDSYVALQTAKKIGMHTVGIYDENNYGQEILRASSDHYIEKGRTMMDLVGRII